MNINKIITETINRYLNENIFDETSKTNQKHPKNAKSDKEKDEGEDEDFISDQDAQHIINRFHEHRHLINIAALAREIYPNHTDEGAQSQLRKKIEREKNDNGVPYKITKREAKIIMHVLDSVNF